MKKFWEIENITDTNSPLSNEDLFCDNHFKNTHYHTSEGRYCVSMPMKDGLLLGESKEVAKKRLKPNLEKIK